MKYCKLLAAASVLAVAGSAHAAHAEIDGIGGSVVVRPHAVPGVFGAAVSVRDGNVPVAGLSDGKKTVGKIRAAADP